MSPLFYQSEFWWFLLFSPSLFDFAAWKKKASGKKPPPSSAQTPLTTPIVKKGAPQTGLHVPLGALTNGDSKSTSEVLGLDDSGGGGGVLATMYGVNAGNPHFVFKGICRLAPTSTAEQYTTFLQHWKSFIGLIFVLDLSFINPMLVIYQSYVSPILGLYYS